MTKAEEKIQEVMDSTKEVWGEAQGQGKTEALRWWRAYRLAQQYIEDGDVQALAEALLDGVKPEPDTIEEIAEQMWKEVGEDEDALQEELDLLGEFYS